MYKATRSAIESSRFNRTTDVCSCTEHSLHTKPAIRSPIRTPSHGLDLGYDAGSLLVLGQLRQDIKIQFNAFILAFLPLDSASEPRICMPCCSLRLLHVALHRGFEDRCRVPIKTLYRSVLSDQEKIERERQRACAKSGPKLSS